MLESAAMKTARRLLATVPVALALVMAGVQSAAAQVVIDPTSSPVQNNSATGPLGPLPSIAALMFALGVAILIFLVISYMRFAPRFSRDEENVKVVRADRVHLGRELPRRAVDISQAVAVVVAPPAVPVADGAVAIAPAPAAAAPAPVAPAPAAAAPAPASAPAPAPAAEAAPAPAAPAAPAPAAEERPEVSLDEEVFQQTLDELLAKGTDRRVAEGQARRAAMIAARKKAAGG
ncbi:MAG: hypothetical protein QOC54_1407 [Baekduia sp.]|nr:hypothetical protein [Baekduia sp.]